MKLYNGKMVIAGIVVFLIAAAFPFWYGRGKTVPPPELRLDTPAIERLTEKRCVEATAYMRANHMKLLVAWRDGAVREGTRSYRTTDGRAFPVSLTGTCLGCHSNKDKFCDRCHDYTGSKPACWSCHIIPEEAVEKRPSAAFSSSFAVQRTSKYASRLRISEPLLLDVFEQPPAATFSTGCEEVR